MCAKRKQSPLFLAPAKSRALLWASCVVYLSFSAPIWLAGTGMAAQAAELNGAELNDAELNAASDAQDHQTSRLAMGAALGEASGGVTDRVFVAAPPHAAFVVERAAGSFVDCGAGMQTANVGGDGRALTPLPCGVTLTETLFVPTAAASAKVFIHF